MFGMRLGPKSSPAFVSCVVCNGRGERESLGYRFRCSPCGGTGSVPAAIVSDRTSQVGDP